MNKNPGFEKVLAKADSIWNDIKRAGSNDLALISCTLLARAFLKAKNEYGLGRSHEIFHVYLKMCMLAPFLPVDEEYLKDAEPVPETGPIDPHNPWAVPISDAAEQSGELP